MSAQTFNGVRVGGNALRPSIVNQSDKPIIGYVVQRIGDSGYDAVVSVVDFHSLAVGKAIQPGEEHPFGRFNVIRIASQSQAVGTPLGYELRGVLFADGTFYGPDEIFLDFSERISAIRSFALGMLNDENKYQTLAQHVHVLSAKEILQRMRTATDMRAFGLDSDIASIILDIRSRQGEQEAEAALARLAALPEVWKAQ